MNFIRVVICLLSIYSSSQIFAQIKISEHIQPSTLNIQEYNALYLVDFWATWCGPCISASKYIESLQSQFNKNFYVLSLSKENPELVKRFMEKRPSGLAVAIDFEGDTFTKNSITSLPYAILYNAKGEKIWKGHPADLKSNDVKRFLNQNKNQISKDKMFLKQAYKNIDIIEEEDLEDNFQITELQDGNMYEYLSVISHDSYFELKGSLQDIIAYLYSSSKSQVEVPTPLNKQYKMKFKLNNKNGTYERVARLVLKRLKLKVKEGLDTGEVLTFNIDSPTFWDTNQIDWGPETQHFLVGNSDIKADNVTLYQIKYKLSNLLQLPIVFNEKPSDEDLHDWDIHYKYFELMASNMLDNYGIRIEKNISEYIKYIIRER